MLLLTYTKLVISLAMFVDINLFKLLAIMLYIWVLFLSLHAMYFIDISLKAIGSIIILSSDIVIK